MIIAASRFFSLGKQHYCSGSRLVYVKGNIIRDYYIIYFSRFFLPLFIKAAGISLPITTYHLVHIFSEADFHMWA